eukprot:483334_1
MSSFLFSLSFVNLYISLYNAQYFNCTGYRSCWAKTMNCVDDCTIDCIGEWACGMATINAENGNVYLNCNGGIYSCGYQTIYAKTANLLRVNASGYYALYSGNILCPQNNYCNITAAGDTTLSRATITGLIGSKLFIKANGYSIMKRATIHCPPDYLPGTKYTNDAICDISADGNYALEFTEIYANEGFNDVKVKCESSICYQNTNNPFLYCGELLDQLCVLQSGLQNNSYELICDTNICNEI